MSTEERIKIIVICGPTATGKSDLALALARATGGEVVSADSMQVYRYMDIGTAKPGPRQRTAAAHHLIDVADPDEDYTAARYRREAASAIEDIHRRGRVPIVAGGTGLYIKALTEGLFEGPGADPALRQEFLHEAESRGPQALYSRLKEVDPAASSSIHPNNLRRVIRALEVFHLSGRPISEFQKGHNFPGGIYDTVRIGLVKERESLYRDIEKRVDRMMEAGLLEETERLLKMGYSPSLKSMGGLGYRELCEYIRGRTSLDEAVRLIKRNTRHYAKRQLTWFRKYPGLRWFHPEQRGAIVELVKRCIE